METEQLKKNKRKLEQAIWGLLKDFTARTGVLVTEIDLRTVKTGGYDIVPPVPALDVIFPRRAKSNKRKMDDNDTRGSCVIGVGA